MLDCNFISLPAGASKHHFTWLHLSQKASRRCLAYNIALVTLLCACVHNVHRGEVTLLCDNSIFDDI